jgi:hypothetical protein
MMGDGCWMGEVLDDDDGWVYMSASCFVFVFVFVLLHSPPFTHLLLSLHLLFISTFLILLSISRDDT